MEEIINDLLAYDGLKVYQRPDMFNFSLDSLMLGYFARIDFKTKKIIDLCTGNAPVAMYLTLRTDASIDAVEIQKDVYDLADKSIKLNNLAGQIKLYLNDLKGISQVVGKECYDLVTCNPPYFKLNQDSNLNANEYKTIARHEVNTTLEDVLNESKKLLKNRGYLTMVHRPDRLAEILRLLKDYNLNPKTIRFIYPKKDSNANSVIIEAQKNSKEGLKVLEPIIVHENNQYSKIVSDIFNYRKGML